MGVAALAAIAGIGLMAGGAASKSSAASKKLKALREAEDMWLPDTPGGYASDFFSEMEGYAPKAGKLADEIAEGDMARALRMREQALPGIGKATGGAVAALAPLLRGELPDSVMQAFQRAGGASTVGLGMGGSGFGFLNTGLFGARGALGAMQTGFGLLPALMSTLPNVNSPGASAFLQAIMTPAQRTQAALQFRQQQLGLRGIASGMQTSGDIWGGTMSQAGGILLGGAMGGGMGGMGGGMGMAMGPSGMGYGNMPSSNMDFLGGHERITGGY